VIASALSCRAFRSTSYTPRLLSGGRSAIDAPSPLRTDDQFHVHPLHPTLFVTGLNREIGELVSWQRGLAEQRHPIAGDFNGELNLHRETPPMTKTYYDSWSEGDIRTARPSPMPATPPEHGNGASTFIYFSPTPPISC